MDSDMKTKVLSIDDNPVNRAIIELALQDHFNLVSSDGKEPFIELIAKVQPQIILLDVQLEGKNGFDLCKSLRYSSQDTGITVIFVSGLTSEQDKLTGYACGGDDYITKPVNVPELAQKLKAIEKKIIDRCQLSEQCQQATNVAFTSMKNASELGLLIEFFNDTLAISDPDQLFDKVSDFCSQFELNFSLEIRLNGQFLQYPQRQVAPLELKILELGRTAQRIVNFENNILFNSDWCSILIKHLPKQDEALIGRIRDHFAVLLGIIDSRLIFMNSENSRLNIRKDAIASLSRSLAIEFSEIKQHVQYQENQLLQLLSDLTIDMDKKTLSMGLTEEQELDLCGLFDETKERFKDVISCSANVDNKLKDMNKILTKID